MSKFIELSLYKRGTKIFIAVDKIVALIPFDDGTSIVVRSDRTGKGAWGYDVREGYEQLKCMITGVFEGTN